MMMRSCAQGKENGKVLQIIVLELYKRTIAKNKKVKLLHKR